MIAPPQTIVYDTPAIVQELVSLSHDRGTVCVDAGPDTTFTASQRVAKIPGRTIWGDSVPQIVTAIKHNIDRGQYGAMAHEVAVDEVMPKFSNHWKAGRNFSRAMWVLHKERTPWGGTYASRVEVFVSPSIVTDIASGYGTAWFSQVMPALAMAGGVHLEMYHGGKQPLKGFSTKLWRTAPTAFLDVFKHYEGKQNRVHFVFTATTMPMRATWKAARATAINRAILANGPDEWSLKTQALQWLQEYNHA